MAAKAKASEAKPLRNILHPALVHLPVALLPLSVALDVASFFASGRDLFLVRGAFVFIIGGVSTGLFAAIFGLMDYADIRRDHPAKKIATRHMALNIVALALFAVSAVMRYDALDAMRPPPLAFALSLVGLATLAYSGYLGGTLVYDDGIGVGRHRRHSRTPRETISTTASGHSVAVADANSIRDGETLRVDVNGTVIAIVRLAGGFHAFQEFCTHRYGPLSEGGLQGCEVVCPWHRSRFDVRNGRVTQGPAKIDLRTFRTEVRDGKIWLEVPTERNGKTNSNQ